MNARSTALRRPTNTTVTEGRARITTYSGWLYDLLKSIPAHVAISQLFGWTCCSRMSPCVHRVYSKLRLHRDHDNGRERTPCTSLLQRNRKAQERRECIFMNPWLHCCESR